MLGSRLIPPPTITIVSNMNPLLHLLQPSPPCPRSASSLNQAPSSVSPVPVLSLPDTVFTFISLHSCDVSFFTLHIECFNGEYWPDMLCHRSFQNGCRFRKFSSTSSSLTPLHLICCRSQRSNTNFLSSCPLRVWSSTPPGPTACQMTH